MARSRDDCEARPSEAPAGVGIRLRLALVVVATLVALSAWLPLLAEHPQTWDEIQYILGVRDFDLEKHQPHPPGYYLHVKTAALLRDLGLGEMGAVRAVSLAAGAVFVGLIVWWVTGASGPWAAATAAVVTVLNPIVATAATDGRTYMTGALGASVVGGFSWCILRGDKRWVIPSGLALGITAGLRPTAAVFIAPVWLWAVSQSGWRQALPGAIATAAATAAWAVPFMADVGGFARFLDLSGRLSGNILETSGSEAGLLSEIAANVPRAFWGLILLLGAGLVGLARGLRSHSRSTLSLVLLWTVPPLLFFILVHTGTPLYVMVIAAPLLAPAAVGLYRLGVAELSGSWRIGAFLALVVVQCSLTWVTVMLPRRQMDAEFREIAAALGPLADGHTVALTTTGDQPAAEAGYLQFRHAGYLLPEAHVYVFPLDLHGPPGTMPNYAHQMSTGLVAPPVVDRDARRLLLLASGLRAFLPPGRPARPVYEGKWFTAWSVDLTERDLLTLDAGGKLTVTRKE